jgi:hypothetical protein
VARHLVQEPDDAFFLKASQPSLMTSRENFVA